MINSNTNNLAVPYETSQFTQPTSHVVPYEQQFQSINQQIDAQRYWQKVADANIAIAKAAKIEEIRTNAWLHRQHLKEVEAERKKTVFDELLITKGGNFEIVSRNSSVIATPRKVCNATDFKSFLLKNNVDDSLELLLVVCNVDNKPTEIFFHPQKLEKTCYIARKFANAGVIFYLTPKTIKDFFFQMIAQFYTHVDSICFLPEETGWIQEPGGTFEFIHIDKEELTWKQAIKKAN